MRPIVKGRPLKNGKEVSFGKYGEARPYLENNTGHYCHFCEMPVKNSPAVEHIKPKALHPLLVCDWDNLMLICTYCNSGKTKKSIEMDDYYWPHQHNTYYIFDYNIEEIFGKKGLPSVSDTLTQTQQEKAQRTIDLYKLRVLSSKNGDIDRRLKFRLEAISKAIACKQEYQKQKITEDAIYLMAEAAGFWSVWFSVFKDEPKVLAKLLTFKGVHIASFDTNNYDPIPRNPHNPIDSI